MSRKASPVRHPAQTRRSNLWTFGFVAILLLAGLALFASLTPSEPDPFEGMVRIDGGTFWMGRDPEQCDSSLCCMPGQKDALPIHEVELDSFWLDRTPVTNAQFERFVKATGYQTQAERHDARMTPDGEIRTLPPGSFVFRPREGVTDLRDHFQWWEFVNGADWRHPEGPDSGIADRMDHPVVQVSWDDAAAYCKWAGRRLPTEAEFEFAARGGLDRQRFAWGDKLTPEGGWRTNIWQGKFPNENTEEDGHRGTSPVRTYPANDYGLHDMSGNIWQWCSDWYRPDFYENSPRKNPKGPSSSFDPTEPGVPKRVQRGGSFLCSDLYCQGYQPGSRHKSETNSAANHTGFRTARDVVK